MSLTVSTIDEQGQIVLPEEVLLAHGLKKGDQVEIVTRGGATIIRALQPRLRGFHEDQGRFPLPPEEGSAVDWQRSLRDEEDEEFTV